jgi:hypothetical protein
VNEEEEMANRVYAAFDPAMPEPYGKVIWVPRLENAHPFSSKVMAQASGSQIKGATGIAKIGDP